MNPNPTEILPTVQIHTKNGPVTINESDFDPKIHKLAGEKEVENPPKGPEFSSPQAAAFAEENKLTAEEIASIKPSGAGDKITKDDVKNFLAAKTPAVEDVQLMVMPVEGGFQIIDMEGKPLSEEKFTTQEEAEKALEELKK